ncbi:hypothetical protein MP638_006922 [Amoeboaphelidium occidentale]|nr:hypothetical protein MP638_006922 [Amoeboaphelidium occidentale]
MTKQNNKKSLYEILELTSSSSSSSCKDSIITLRDIKKQYHKLSLKYHPDKNNGKYSEELFKEINYAYSILSDEQKREKYDATGEIGADGGADGGGGGEFNWMDYFNSIKKLSTDDFNEFKKEYIGSKEEEEDLIKLYLQFNGSLMKIIENSYFGRIEDDDDDEERYFQLLEKKIEEGKLERLSDWRLLNRRERITLKKRQEREEKELEKVMVMKEQQEKSLSISNVKRKNEEMFDSLIAGLEAKYGRGNNNNNQKKKKTKKNKKNKKK